MQDDIEKIITDGTFAPSGENCQPWKFEVKGLSNGARISIFNIPELDQSIYNFQQKGSYVAHGALIENIIISAAHHGYKTEVSLFPKPDYPDLVSIIKLEKGFAESGFSTTPHPLHAHIKHRHTNRKEHQSQKLSSEQKTALLDAAKGTGFGKLRIVDDAHSLEILGDALAVNEQIIFENKQLHRFFYDHILWDEKDQEKAGGFYVKTLEFLPHQLKGVKVFKRWSILRVLNKIAKVSRVIAKENAQKYAKSGALAVVAVDGNTPSDYVHAGQIAQRVWLTATQIGISVHPCTGVLYFMENIRGGNGAVFSDEHRTAIEKAYNDIVRVFKADALTMPMLFRLGFADSASARSMRMKANIVYT
jgi:hypothetical protein